MKLGLVWSVERKKWLYFDDDNPIVVFDQDENDEYLNTNEKQPYLIFFKENSINFMIILFIINMFFILN